MKYFKNSDAYLGTMIEASALASMAFGMIIGYQFFDNLLAGLLVGIGGFLIAFIVHSARRIQQ